jgi:uncharacterized membrane protein YqhA
MSVDHRPGHSPELDDDPRADRGRQGALADSGGAGPRNGDQRDPSRRNASRDGARPDRDRRPLDHPSPISPLAGLIGRSRFVVLVAVVSVLLVSVALFVIGAGLAVQGVWQALVGAIRGDLNSTTVTVDLLEVVSVMLKAVVFYLIGVGFYSLFIAPLNLTTALGIRSFNDLEIKVVSVVVVIMAVTFLEHFIRWDQAVETLLYGLSLGVVVGALVFFQKHSHREAREDEHEDARARLRAQREMFHQDEEEREVLPDDVPEASPEPRVESRE